MDGRSLEVDFGDQKDRFVVSDCFIHLYKPRVYSSPDRIISVNSLWCLLYTRGLRKLPVTSVLTHCDAKMN